MRSHLLLAQLFVFILPSFAAEMGNRYSHTHPDSEFSKHLASYFNYDRTQLKATLQEHADIARKVIRQAFNKTGRKGFRQISNAIDDSRVVLLSDSDSTCEKYGGWTYINDRTIHICPESVQSGDRTYLIQLILHEAAHAAGEEDECETDKWAMRAMRAVYNQVDQGYGCAQNRNI